MNEHECARTRTKQLRAPLTTMLGHPKSTQCNFNSCSFNYKSDYRVAEPTVISTCSKQHKKKITQNHSKVKYWCYNSYFMFGQWRFWCPLWPQVKHTGDPDLVLILGDVDFLFGDLDLWLLWGDALDGDWLLGDLVLILVDVDFLFGDLDPDLWLPSDLPGDAFGCLLGDADLDLLDFSRDIELSSRWHFLAVWPFSPHV